jgi:hypothetical protein
MLIDKLPSWIVWPFKKALGIASPSKVFAEIGEDTIAGYVQGVQDMAKTAGRATTDALTVPSAASTVPAPAQRLILGFEGGDDGILAAFKEAIRVRHGGDVDAALAST